MEKENVLIVTVTITMFVSKIYLECHLIYLMLALVIYAENFDSEMCLEQALTIHSLLKNEKCPYSLLEFKKGFKGCTVQCRAKYKADDSFYNVKHCVRYNITFHINKSLKSSLNDKACNIPKCILDTIYFECTFIGNISEIENHDKLELNKTSFNKTDPRNQQNTTAENRPCLDIASSVLISLSCVFGGCLLGISIHVSLKRLRTSKRRLQPPPMFYQPNYGDEADISGGRIVMIENSFETEYAETEEETLKMVARAVQVPSYKEDSSSETRSRENIYHYLSLIEDSTKRENSAMIPSDFTQDSFANEVILSNKSSPSFKSVVICTDRSSSKSDGNSKVSPTGSAGNDKYYALERKI